MGRSCSSCTGYPKEGRIACPGWQGWPPHGGAGRGYLPEGVMRKWEVVKCPLGGLGERLLVDLAELNFHVCIWTEHFEVYLLQTIHSAVLLHVAEFPTASKSEMSLFFSSQLCMEDLQEAFFSFWIEGEVFTFFCFCYVPSRIRRFRVRNVIYIFI